MKYIGNKTRLIGFIEDCLKQSDILYKGVKVYDLFAGTGSVSEFFLRNDCEVLTCDIMTYSAAEQYRKLFFRNEPIFSELNTIIKDTSVDGILNYLNNLEGYEGYFYDNFGEHGKYGRMFFKDDNAKKIDSIRAKIEEWKEILPYEKYMFLIGILMNSADFVSNTAGTYGAYLKIWRSMALKDIELIKPEFIKTGKIKISLDDVVNFAKTSPHVDIAYMDPPYNTRQYPAYFSALESIVVYDKQQLKGKAGLRDYDNQKSKFSIKKDVLIEFDKLISNIDADNIVISYSTEGIMKVQDMLNVLDKYGSVEVFDQDYRRFKTNSWTSTDTNLKELVIICKRK